LIFYINSTPVHYTVTGSGPAILLIHGFLESSNMWRRLVPLLADKNTVITIDLPGHGASGCLDEVHTMELLAETLHRITEELSIRRISIMGHSMGGYVALAFLEKYQPMVESIVLLNSTSVEDSTEKKKNRDKAIKIIRKNPDLFIGMTIPSLFSEKNRIKFKQDIEILKKEALTFPSEGIIAMLKGMKTRSDRTSVLGNFRGNKFMICGLDDPLFDLSEMETLSIASNSMLYKVQGGHMTVNENWDEFVKIMHFIDFL
jgi:pimeloyl-ACP methyl ester carboxylesterase